MKYLGEVNTIGEAWMKFLEEVNSNGKIVKYSEDKIIKEETGLIICIKKVLLPDNIINKYNIVDNNIIKYDLEDNLDNIIEEASMISLFGDTKLILINATFKEDIDVDKLEEYLKHYNNNTYIVFMSNDKVDTRRKLYKLITKYGTIEEVNGDNNYIRSYIKEYIKDYMIDINYFLSKVSDNLDNIKNELDKLMLYKMEDKNITNKDIDDLVIPNIEEDIFALTDSVITNNVDKSITLYNKFMEKNYEPIYIIGLLGNQFTLLYQVKKLYNMGKNNNDIASILGVHPYRVKLAIQNSYYYTESDLIKYIYKLGNLDKDIKTGNIDKTLGLELFLINKDI